MKSIFTEPLIALHGIGRFFFCGCGFATAAGTFTSFTCLAVKPSAEPTRIFAACGKYVSGSRATNSGVICARADTHFRHANCGIRNGTAMEMTFATWDNYTTARAHLLYNLIFLLSGCITFINKIHKALSLR